jgi:hypothetical protein
MLAVKQDIMEVALQEQEEDLSLVQVVVLLILELVVQL